jgi:hypothetical protein
VPLLAQWEVRLTGPRDSRGYLPYRGVKTVGFAFAAVSPLLDHDWHGYARRGLCPRCHLPGGQPFSCQLVALGSVFEVHRAFACTLVGLVVWALIPLR